MSLGAVAKWKIQNLYILQQPLLQVGSCLNFAALFILTAMYQYSAHAALREAVKCFEEFRIGYIYTLAVFDGSLTFGS